MTKLLDKAVAALRNLPDEEQDDFANFVLALAGSDGALTQEDRAAIEEAEAELARGDQVSAKSMRAFWSSHGL